MSTMRVHRRTWLVCLLCPLVAWASPEFHHEISEGPRPWTDRNFDAAQDRLTFAVFADLTGGERESVFDVAVAQLNLLRPELIVNVGDLIEGDPDPAEVERQWDDFDARARKALAPVFYTGGNHDLLGDTLRQAWAERLGDRYYHFVYKDVLFLVLDTEDHTPERSLEMTRLRAEALEVAAAEGWDAFAETEYARLPENAAGNVSDEQSAYFLEVLKRYPDVRHTFLLMHKAPWLREDLDAFTALEAALGARPYTVFHGHEHGYVYRQRHGRDYIQLATTGGVFLPENGDAYDQLLLVTVHEDVTIANLKMSGILDKTGRLPRDGGGLCLDHTDCPDE